MGADWPLKRISEVAAFQNNRRVPLRSLDRQKRQGQYPYYGASGVVDHIDDYIFDGTFLLISEDGENLRTRKTPVAYKASGKFWVNNHAHILEEKEEGILDYLEYYFSKLDLTPYITGAVQPKLNKANLDAIEIPIPPREERSKINRVLNSFTNKIELNTQTNQTLEQIAQAIFKSWFVDFEPVKAKMEVLAAGGSAEQAELAAMSAISAKDEVALKQLQTEQPDSYVELAQTAALFPSAMEESELGEIPAGWEWGTLADIASFATERVAVSEVTKENYISTENMLENKRGISVAAALPGGKTVPLFEKGQILVSNIRPYFKKIWLARFNGGRSPDVLGFVSKDPEAKEFVFNFLYQDLFFEFMMTTSKGAKMPRGDKDAIMNYQLALPSQVVQRAYSSLVKSYYDTIENLNSQNKSLASIRDTLLPKLLSGEIELSNVDNRVEAVA